VRPRCLPYSVAGVVAAATSRAGSTGARGGGPFAPADAPALPRASLRGGEPFAAPTAREGRTNGRGAGEAGAAETAEGVPDPGLVHPGRDPRHEPGGRTQPLGAVVSPAPLESHALVARTRRRHRPTWRHVRVEQSAPWGAMDRAICLTLALPRGGGRGASMGASRARAPTRSSRSGGRV
jgi:hypothetical protein